MTDEGPAQTVRARVVTSRRRVTVARLRERVADAFWIVPAAFLAGGVGLALAARAIDETADVRAGQGPWWVGTQAGASTVLSTVATSMLTFLGVVFSITLVALQLASQQFSPRVTRTFVRSMTTKVTLGVFIATFACALLSLAAVERGLASGATAPVLSVSVVLLLVGASLVVFVAFVNNTTRLIRIAHIIGAVADETRGSIEENYPPASVYVPVAPPSPDGPPAHVVRAVTGRRLRGSDRGVLLAVDVPHLVELARSHGCTVHIVPRLGEFLPGGAALAEVRGDRPPPDWRVLRAVSVGRERTLYQDPAYGLRQLVDIAAQSLSAAVNAPTTAVQVLDRIVDLLPRIAERPDPTGLFADSELEVRLSLPVTTWPEIVRLAFTEIRTFGSASPQVVRRVMAALDDLLARVPPERREPLERERELMRRAAAANLPVADVLEDSLVPDRLGLG